MLTLPSESWWGVEKPPPVPGECPEPKGSGVGVDFPMGAQLTPLSASQSVVEGRPSQRGSVPHFSETPDKVLTVSEPLPSPHLAQFGEE